MDQTNSIAQASSTPTKDEFKQLVGRLNVALSQHATVYPQLIATASAFDRELAAKIEAAAEADADLLRYLKDKAESQKPQGIIATIGALLLGR